MNEFVDIQLYYKTPQKGELPAGYTCQASDGVEDYKTCSCKDSGHQIVDKSIKAVCCISNAAPQITNCHS